MAVRGSPRVSVAKLGHELQRLATADVTRGELLSIAADRIAQVIPHDGCCVSSTDPGTVVLVDTWTSGIPAGEFATAFYECEHGPPDFGSHEALVADRRHAAVLSALTGGDPMRSSRYRRLLGPMGMEHELRAVAIDRDAPWGFIHLYRRRGRRDFDGDELAGLQRAAPMFAAALRGAAGGSESPAARHPPAPATRATPTDTTVTSLVDRNLRIVGRAGPAQQWLDEMHDSRRPGPPLPVGVLGIVLGALAGGPPKPVRMLAPSGSWWLLSGARLENAVHRDTVVVTAALAAGTALTGVRMLILGLTAGERRVCELVVDGASTKLIAHRLHLSSYTVQDRLKAIFVKARVGSRGELVALLMQ